MTLVPKLQFLQTENFTDGVAMGSPVSPTLANVIMIALEDAIVKYLPHRHNNIIKFY